MEEDPANVVALAEGITFPILLDADHLLAELYAVSDVPTVIWIDEADRIVRPNTHAFSTDMFSEFTGVKSEPYRAAVRSWVRDGVVEAPEEGFGGVVADLDDDEVEARLRFRLAVHLRRAGDEAAAQRQFDSATQLAPLDFTIARAALPLTGRDPFGEDFFGLYERFLAEGRPFHGLSLDES